MASAYFFDSSAIVKRYVRETGTGWVRRLTRRGQPDPIYLARITAVEVTSDPSTVQLQGGGQLHGIVGPQFMSIRQSHGSIGQGRRNLHDEIPRSQMAAEEGEDASGTCRRR